MANNKTKAKTTGGDKKSIISKLGGQTFIIMLVVIALIVFFSIASSGFRKYTTFVSLFDYVDYYGLMAIGVAFPLMTAGVDLSIGTGMVCYSLIGGYLVVQMGCPTGVGLLVSILLGVGFGLLNGCLVGIMDLPPFLATLCTSMIARGLGDIVVGGYGIPWPTSSSDQGWFRSIWKIELASGTKIPIGIVWVVLAVVVMAFVLNHTKVGRYTLAIGSNKEAARLSGVNVKKYHILAYVICGLFAGLASTAYSSVYATIQPGSGSGFELDAIGAAIIGGVSMSGGMGSIVGTFFGVLVICLLKTGLPFVGLNANWQQIITGIVLIAAVMIDIIKRKRQKL